MNLQIRRSGQAVQDRPLWSIGWADIPELSTCAGCRSAAWLQSQRNGADPRPSGRPPPLVLAAHHMAARTLQGMVRVRSGQAPAWLLVSGRSVRRGFRVKRDFTSTFTGHVPSALVAQRSQSRLGREGRTRTLSGPSPDLSLVRTPASSVRCGPDPCFAASGGASSRPGVEARRPVKPPRIPIKPVGRPARLTG
jgi:hypothetical protein